MSGLAETRAAHAAGDAAELHIAGVLLQARPCSIEHVRTALGALPEVEIFHAAPDGRMVLVAEAGSSRAVMTVLETMRDIEGVLDVALVYQHAEPAADLQEEISP